ncbi:hypothetical protein D3C73_1170310 [compost metagenome]
MRGVAQHRRTVQQDNSLDLGVHRHFDIGCALGQESAPRRRGLTPDGARTRRHVAINLFDHRLHQAALVAEVVIERAAGEAGLGGEVIHRRPGIALLGESLATRAHKLCARLFDHFAARSSHQANLHVTH